MPPEEESDSSRSSDAPTRRLEGPNTGSIAEADTLLPADENARDSILPADLNGMSEKIRYFGDYELLSEIARGGMGVVYKAKQVNLNRLVALKMILAGQLASDEDVKRFYTEAEAAAALEHPGIVPIFEIGTHNDQHFFSMGFVDGGSLADKVKDGPLPSQDAAIYTKKVAEAIAYAHSKGVIHRDLKPANVLLDRNGEPKVTDFGLARRAESNSDLTRTGAVMGTPSYMPPEQAAGKTGEVGPLADVYSLGAILYCLLTGRPPFQSSNPLDTLLQVIEREPASVTILNPAAPKDLETICHKCLQKDPAKRYASAKELADDIARWTKGEPIRARAISHAERTWRWVKRNPVVSGSIAATVAAILLGSALSVWFGMIASREATLTKIAMQDAVKAREEASREALKARTQQSIAESSLERAELSNYANNLILATDAFSEGRYDKAWWLMEKCQTHLRGWEYHYLRASHDNSCQTILTFDSGIREISYSSDGQQLITQYPNALPKSWSISTGTQASTSFGVVDPLQSLNLSRADDEVAIECFELSPDGTKAFVSSKVREKSGKIELSHRLLNLKSGDVEQTFTCPSAISVAAFSLDGLQLVTGLVNVGSSEPKDAKEKKANVPGILKIWDLKDGREIATIECDIESNVVSTTREPSCAASSVEFDSTGKRVLAVFNESLSDCKVCIVDVESGKLAATLVTADRQVDIANYSPDYKYVLSGSRRRSLNERQSAEGQVQLWEANTGQLIRSFGDSGIALESLAVSPDSQYVAVANADGRCMVWDIDTGERLQTLFGQQSSVRSLVFSPDGRRISAACADGVIKTWKAFDRSIPEPDVSRPMASKSIRIESQHIEKTKFATRSSYESSGALAFNWYSSSNRNFVEFWNARNRLQSALIDYPTIHESLPAVSNVSSDGTKIATGTSSGQVRLWNLATGQVLAEMNFRDSVMTSGFDKGLWLSPDAKYVIVRKNQDIRRTETGSSWTSSAGEIEFRPTFEGGITWSVARGEDVAFAKDSLHVIVLKFGGQIELRSLADGMVEQSFDLKSSGFIEDVEVSPDGLFVAVSKRDQVELWNISNGEMQSELRDGESTFGEICFCPDSKRLVTSHSQEVKMWILSTGQLILNLPRREGVSLSPVCFSDDGQQILAISSIDEFAANFEVWDIGQ